jgi:hypothetical protein
VSPITKASFDPGCRVDGSKPHRDQARFGSAPVARGVGEDLRTGPGTNPDRAPFVLLQILPR